ncbi:DNA polymerase [Amycolatopsis japonica]|uniref:DNA polymerase I n=1 Tax=Amycolatopsis japonica TaxID=208439 RepID=A0A075UW75_9PSEU|nr:DNA polymerase [Amycolatopsis japonica]AIG78422.1 DNA polymerase [Amycolatopsis japonica]
MRVHRHQVAGEQVTIRSVENELDLDQFRDFVRRNLRGLAFDTETTGLNIYGRDFGLRLAQFGTPVEAFTVPVEFGGQFKEDVRRALLGLEKLYVQNGGFDLQVSERKLGIPMEVLWRKTTDTKIPAHLVDPRGREEGGIGHKLEELTAHYIDRVVADEVKGSMARLAKEMKCKKDEVWRRVDIDNPTYQLYGGMDTILAARLAKKVLPLVPVSARNLLPFEHEVAEICSYMERTGFLLDVEYTKRLSERFHEEEEKYSRRAAKLGCENVNSTEQVADVLESRGVRITGRTPKGKRQVDKNLLNRLVKEGDEFATAVVEAKKARKWRTTWVDTFLSTVDENDRCHASINSLRARTARMSITGIPAQTLPSKDWMIRRCFVADPGHLIGSIDYKAQELRVLAARSGDPTMIRAFNLPDDDEGSDLHILTARAAFGAHITKAHKERGYAKVVNFGRVYGGGVDVVMDQTGLDRETATRVVEGFDSAYPKVKVYSKELAQEARRNGYITTMTGRRLPVDAHRAYAALNYDIQSSSRDVTCRGLVKLHRAGFTPYLRLPVHDEVVGSFPAKKAEWGVRRVGDLMSEQMGPVFIGTDPTVTGKSWGHEYMKTDDAKPDLELIARADKEIAAAGLW